MDETRLAQLQEELGAAAGTVLPQLLQVMRRDLPLALNRAREALDAGDAESLANAAHSMKSSSSNLGLDGIQVPASSVEAAARDGDLERAGADLEVLAAAVESELDALEAWLGGRFSGS